MNLLTGDYIAIYAALLSTGLLVINLWQTYSKRKFICIEHLHYISTSENEERNDLYKFIISNRGNSPTTITDILVSIHEHKFFGFKHSEISGRWDYNDDRNPALPHALNPGDTLCVSIPYKLASQHDMPCPHRPNGKFANSRYLHIKHSQSSEELEFKFRL